MARQAKKPSTEASAKTPSDPTTKAKIAETNTVSVKIPVVGLGASAGGVQAFTDFFEALPDKTGMAFVAIHHVDPDHKNLMADLLAKHSKMTVALAQEGTPIAPDHFYIIPPNACLASKRVRDASPNPRNGGECGCRHSTWDRWGWHSRNTQRQEKWWYNSGAGPQGSRTRRNAPQHEFVRSGRSYFAGRKNAQGHCPTTRHIRLSRRDAP